MSIEAMNWARKVGRAGAELGLLSPGAILLLWSLADRADQDWSCFPSIKHDLAPDSAQSERSIERHLKLFRELGVVTTEEFRNQMGYRIGGHRFFLHESALSELQAQVKIARLESVQEVSEQEKNPEIPVNAKLAGRTKSPGKSVSAKLAGRDENPEIPVSANLAGREPSRQIGGSLPAKHDKKSSGAFNRIARGFNHQQQQPREDVDVVVDSVPKVFAVDDPETLFDGWQTDVNDEMDLLHRGVDVLKLAGMGTMFQQKHSVEVWREVINLVLDRTTTTVRSPHQYVLAAFGSSARALMLEAVQNLKTPTQSAQEAAGAPIMVKCEDHSWSGRQGAVCPSCRADALAGEPSTTEPVAEALTEDQIASLPAAYRHMASPGFQAPTPSLDFGLDDPHDDDDVAPWDRDDVVRL